jgi:hypothetical protein
MRRFMTSMTNSAVVRAKLAIMGAPLGAAFARYHAHPDQARVVSGWLLHLHQIMRASVPLMEAARRRAAELGPADAVGVGLCAYFDEHIEEERHHDTWMLEDLEAAGMSPAEALARIPSPQLAAAVGAQYYWILHHHPVGLLGYIAVLEGEPPSDQLIDSMQARSKLPSDAFRTLRKHGQLDPTHGRELDHLLDSLPLTPEHASLIGLSIAHTTSSLALCIEALLAST